MNHFQAPFCSLLLTMFAGITYADGYNANTNGGYVAQATGGYGATTTDSVTYNAHAPATAPVPTHSHPRRHHHKEPEFAISLNISDGTPRFAQPTTVETVRYDHRHHHVQETTWVTSSSHHRLPKHIVTGGHQPHPPATLYVCRGSYQGGMHPGKLFNGACHIGWGGNEIVISSHYDVLISRHPLRWVASSYGRIPARAIEGGYQHDGPLYICQARYKGGMHTGKVYQNACLIGWGGKEIELPDYYVLTR